MTAFRQQKNFALDPLQKQDARAALSELPDGMTLAEAVRLAKRANGVAVDRKTVREVADLFMRSRTDAGRRGGSIAWYESKLKPIIGQFGGEPMDAITRVRLEAFVGNMRQLRTSEPLSSATKAAHYRAVRALWRWARGQEPALAGRDITEGIKVTAAKQDSDGAAFLTVSDAKAILTNLRPRHRPAAALLLFAGIRPQEVAGIGKPAILWKHVDPVGKTISVEASISKTRSRRVLQGLPDTIWPWLGTPGKPDAPVSACTSQQLIRAIQQAGKFWSFSAKGRAGHKRRKVAKKWVKDVTRHTFASYHIAAFDDPGKCALLLGHGGNPRMLYTHYLGLASKADALEFWAICPTESP